MVVDGTRYMAEDLEVWACAACGESLLHIKEWERAEEEIRKKYSGQFRLRVAPALHAKLVQAAKDDHRSLNQEVVYLIQQGMKAAKKS